MLARTTFAVRETITLVAVVCIFCLGISQQSHAFGSPSFPQSGIAAEHSAEPEASAPCMGQCDVDGAVCGGGCGVLVQARAAALIGGFRVAIWPHLSRTLAGRSVGFDPGPPR